MQERMPGDCAEMERDAHAIASGCTLEPDGGLFVQHQRSLCQVAGSKVPLQRH
jgi:hypothetical protein